MNDNIIMIKKNELNISTITTTGSISNIKIEPELINKLELSDLVIKFGKPISKSDFIEKKDERYDNLIKSKQKIKSNRGRKKMIRTKLKNKYFRSCITFTLLDDGNFFDIKLFNNGIFQIPGVKNEDINIKLGIINQFIDYINNYQLAKINSNEDCVLVYFDSIMCNYNFKLYISLDEYPNQFINLNLYKISKIFNNFNIFKNRNIKIKDFKFQCGMVLYDETNKYPALRLEVLIFTLNDLYNFVNISNNIINDINKIIIDNNFVNIINNSLSEIINDIKLVNILIFNIDLFDKTLNINKNIIKLNEQLQNYDFIQSGINDKLTEDVIIDILIFIQKNNKIQKIIKILSNKIQKGILDLRKINVKSIDSIYQILNLLYKIKSKSTIKIFGSCKINIDNSINRDIATNIKNMIIKQLYENREDIFFIENKKKKIINNCVFDFE
jgi:hypothetical protein